MDYNERVGERLRLIRLQRGMSLQDVHRATDGEFKAAVLGAYERGERSLSLPRLHRLAACYDVPINQLLPDEDGVRAPIPASGGVAIDLTRVDDLPPEVGEIVDRFLQRIQIQRQDFNGRVLTVRQTDIALLATLLDMDDADLSGHLQRD